jgi:acyl carrier protein
MSNHTLENIQAGLLQWCGKRLRAPVPVSLETKLLDGAYLDSLLIMDMVVSIEKQYGVAIDSSEISPRNFQCIKTIAALVASHNGNGQELTKTQVIA